MTPKDIVIGKLYRNAEYPNVVYLGCGSYPYPSGKQRKFLIILKEAASPDKFSGIRVQFQNNEVSKNFWKNFYPY